MSLFSIRLSLQISFTHYVCEKLNYEHILKWKDPAALDTPYPMYQQNKYINEIY